MSEKNKNKAVKIIKSLIALVGVTAGIIISAIGAIMFLQSMFKLYLFDIKQDRYDSWEYRCQQYDIDSVEARRLLGDDFLPMVESKVSQKKSDKKLSKEEEYLNEVKEFEALSGDLIE